MYELFKVVRAHPHPYFKKSDFEFLDDVLGLCVRGGISTNVGRVAFTISAATDATVQGVEAEDDTDEEFTTVGDSSSFPFIRFASLL